jgi:hypothetical protein
VVPVSRRKSHRTFCLPSSPSSTTTSGKFLCHDRDEGGLGWNQIFGANSRINQCRDGGIALLEMIVFEE